MNRAIEGKTREESGSSRQEADTSYVHFRNSRDVITSTIARVTSNVVALPASERAAYRCEMQNGLSIHFAPWEVERGSLT